MSAFVVTDLTIHTILATVAVALRGRGALYVEALTNNTGGLQYDLQHPGTLDKVGLELLTQNERSVAFRYREPVAQTGYTFKPVAPTSPVAALKLIQCVAYQCCETDDWRDTLARRILDSMTDELVMRLPGYEAAPWGVDERHRAPAAA